MLSTENLIAESNGRSDSRVASGILPWSQHWQYRLLRSAYPRIPRTAAPIAQSRASELLGDRLVRELAGKVVLDFGCGLGGDAIAMVRLGAARVIGVDIRPEILEIARRNAAVAGVADRCTFTTQSDEPVDVATSIDAFEHFENPGEMLRLIHHSLRPGGRLLFSFGPTWHHPLGGHLFSVFPWAHLLFSEAALLRWRADFIADGATRFGEVGGGLNQMTIRRFESLLRESPFHSSEVETVPIRRLRSIHSSLTREFTTAIIRGSCRKAT